MAKDHWHYFLAHHIQQKVSSGHTNSLPHHGVRKSQKKCLIQHGVKQCYQAAGYFPLVLLGGKCQSSKNSNGTFRVIFQQYASFLFIVIQAEKDFGFRNDHENNAGETSCCSSNPSSSIVVASLLCFLQRSHRKWKI